MGESNGNTSEHFVSQTKSGMVGGTGTHNPGAWASKIIKNVEKPLPARLIILGGAGIGKTTFASTMPKPLLIDYDNEGSDQSRVDRIRGPKLWTDLLQLLRNIADDPSGYKTLAIDTLDGAEVAC